MTVNVVVEYAEHGTMKMRNHINRQICVVNIAK